MNPDNLAIEPDTGRLFIQEDRFDAFRSPRPGMPNNSLWVSDSIGTLRRFTTAPRGTEVTGAEFAPDGTLFFNIQSSEEDLRSKVLQVIHPD